ncbi:tail tape measure protein [Pseudodesulfovibrio indicus]|uniref:Phage tail tape-measure protein n=1 Tax=Pseudodesulfovibrio indicus TaxID=1716143 RepID=A0A140D8Y6_9BACT|nr:tail tape measure protein [Pseudodesulfovibrio indicus]AMK09653.1 tail tape measure protein [Pseudodesulfovibrio indicus]TDT86395.1 phage tail tape-measure protein [Pseudodesulfovibrio indicus]
MSNMRTSVILDLAGNLQGKAKSYSSALGNLASRGSRSLDMLRRSTAAAGRGLDALGNRYTALVTGAAGLGTARMLIGTQTRFTRLGIQASIAEKQVEQLKQQIYEVAQAPIIRVDPGQITSAIEQIVELTGDLKFAEDNIRNIGVAISATGAAGQDVGALLAEFQKMDIKSPDQVLEALDILNAQGKMGAFTLQNLAALGPRVITAYTAAGRGGTGALREMGAALQMIRMGTGSSEMAATAFEATMRTLSDPAKLKRLKNAGIDAWKEGMLRPINEIMAEIITKTGGDTVKLGRIFDAEAVRAFNQAAGEFKRTGSLDSLAKFMAVQGDGATTLADSARAAKDASAGMTSLYTAWSKFADNRLSGIIEKAADALNALGSEGADKLMAGLGYGAAALGALVVGRKVYNGVRGLRGLFGGKGGAAGAAGSLLGGMKTPLPVYVVNKQMSLMPGEYGGGWQGGGKSGNAISKRGGRLGKTLAGAGKWGGRIGGALAMAGTAYELYDAWTDDSASTSAKVNASGGAVGSGLGGWGGAVAGAQLGAALGSIVPGLGTAIGAAIGGVGGGIAGAWAGGNLGEQLMDLIGFGKQERPEGKLRIEVSDDRTRVTRMDASGMELDVDSGIYMAGVGR